MHTTSNRQSCKSWGIPSLQSIYGTIQRQPTSWHCEERWLKTWTWCQGIIAFLPLYVYWIWQRQSYVQCKRLTINALLPSICLISLGWTVAMTLTSCLETFLSFFILYSYPCSPLCAHSFCLSRKWDWSNLCRWRVYQILELRQRSITTMPNTPTSWTLVFSLTFWVTISLIPSSILLSRWTSTLTIYILCCLKPSCQWKRYCSQNKGELLEALQTSLYWSSIAAI